ncbi:hypothetical protein TNCV_542551 [Trichonephila clavipes]|nr:hypothetical protein TNCV_542551 [Trichonephila clavipes]
MNLAKENGETQQTNINDENMQDLDGQQPSEKRYCSARGYQECSDRKVSVIPFLSSNRFRSPTVDISPSEEELKQRWEFSHRNMREIAVD